ncbi:peroxiredoxin family protein [bacterium]|nr:peroxiredoxin family protein [bacterium]MBU1983931.1 peroxiredoxin family protein [bacterium]
MREFYKLLLILLASLFCSSLGLAVEIRMGDSRTMTDIGSLERGKLPFLRVDELDRKLPLGVIRDASGIMVLRTAYDCVPVYEMDTTEVVVQDGIPYVNAEIVARALGCRMEGKRRSARIQCPETLDTTRVGSAIGERAPGFRLFSADSVLFTLDSLREGGPVVVMFVRPAEWDPVSRALLVGAQQKLDSLRGGGFSVVGIHGYETRFGKRWADSLKLDFPLLSDRFSAVMRGYKVFDKGNLPYPTLFLMDESGIIRLKRVWKEYADVVDWKEIMGAISEKN